MKLMPKRDPLATIHTRIQMLCGRAGIENASQLAVAIARLNGDQRPASELSLAGPRGWWTGTRKPDLAAVVSILAATGGSADWLLLDEGPMTTRPQTELDKIWKVNRKRAADAKVAPYL